MKKRDYQMDLWMKQKRKALQWRSVMRERDIRTIYEERFFCAQKGMESLKYWEPPYFEGINFDLEPITQHFKTEPKRKKIRRRKRKTEASPNKNEKVVDRD